MSALDIDHNLNLNNDIIDIGDDDSSSDIEIIETKSGQKSQLPNETIILTNRGHSTLQKKIPELKPLLSPQVRLQPIVSKKCTPCQLRFSSNAKLLKHHRTAHFNELQKLDEMLKLKQENPTNSQNQNINLSSFADSKYYNEEGCNVNKCPEKLCSKIFKTLKSLRLHYMKEHHVGLVSSGVKGQVQRLSDCPYRILKCEMAHCSFMTLSKTKLEAHKKHHRRKERFLAIRLKLEEVKARQRSREDQMINKDKNDDNDGEIDSDIEIIEDNENAGDNLNQNNEVQGAWSNLNIAENNIHDQPKMKKKLPDLKRIIDSPNNIMIATSSKVISSASPQSGPNYDSIIDDDKEDDIQILN